MPSLSVAIVGAGPGGYAAALEAARRGFSVTLVDRDETGGTCLNRGCIPSKFFLARAQEGSIEPDGLASLAAQKSALLATLRGRMDQAARSARIRRLAGAAAFRSEHELEIQSAEGAEILRSDKVILASGTTPVRPAFLPRHASIHDSSSILSLSRRPEHLLVIGGGYIGCELACAFHGLGSQVTLVEKETALLATQPEFAAAAPVLARAFKQRGMALHLGTEVTRCEAVGDLRLAVALSTGERLEADAVLVAVGRRPDIAPLRLEAAGLRLERDRPVVNAFGQTSVPSIYAIGDLVSALPLAHTATREAEIAIAHMAGESPEPLDYTRIPRCIYTFPEAAAVGLTEEQARSAGFDPRTDRIHLAGNAKALIEEAGEGSWTLLSDRASGRLLGGLLVGAHATEMVHLISVALRGGLSMRDLADTVFAHPTLAEALGEAARRAIYSSPIGLRA